MQISDKKKVYIKKLTQRLNPSVNSFLVNLSVASFVIGIFQQNWLGWLLGTFTFLLRVLFAHFNMK